MAKTKSFKKLLNFITSIFLLVALHYVLPEGDRSLTSTKLCVKLREQPLCVQVNLSARLGFVDSTPPPLRQTPYPNSPSLISFPYLTEFPPLRFLSYSSGSLARLTSLALAEQSKKLSPILQSPNRNTRSPVITSRLANLNESVLLYHYSAEPNDSLKPV